MSRTTRYALYGVIIVICIIAIIVSVFEAVNDDDQPVAQSNTTNETPTNDIQVAMTQEELEESITDFKDFFQNDYKDFKNSDAKIAKELAPDEDEVYTIYTKSEDSIDVALPYINKLDYNAIKVDNDTDYESFYDLIVALNTDCENLAKENDGQSMKVSYTSTYYKNILSIGVFVQKTDENEKEYYNFYAFNYDLNALAEDEKGEVTDYGFNKMLNYVTSGVTLNQEIEKVITSADKYAKDLAETGSKVFERNVDSKMYDVSSTGSYAERQYFIHENNGKPYLYVVYVYGNNSTKPTTAIDVVKIEIQDNE